MASCKLLSSLRLNLHRASALTKLNMYLTDSSASIFTKPSTAPAYMQIGHFSSTCAPANIPSGSYYSLEHAGQSHDAARRRSLLKPAPVTWCVVRLMGKKGKGKGGGSGKGGKGGQSKVTLNSDQLEGLFNVEKYQAELDRVMGELKEKYIHTLTVRTSQGVFDNLAVKTPDGTFPLIQLGQVLQKNPQLIAINLAMSSQYIPHVKEALMTSGLNVNPQQDGTSLFIQLPQVTKEHRTSLAKNAKSLCDASKKDLRQIYSKYSKKIKGAKEGHSADHVKAAEGMAKTMMDKMVSQMDEMTAHKQKELLGGK